MRIFDWLWSRRKQTKGPHGRKRYEYVTGNVEVGVRVDRGEDFFAVAAEVNAMWTPGQEHLWDEYDIESLVDKPEKWVMAVNQLLYSRVTLYRALRLRGRNIRGLDPFRYALEVPETAQLLAAKFPKMLQSGKVFEHADVRPKQPTATGYDAARGDPGILEDVVRQAISDRFQVDPAAVDMERPLASSIQDLDWMAVLDLGEEIMERVEIPVPKDQWEKLLDAGTETDPIRVTPNELVRLFRQVGMTLNHRE